MTTDAEEAVLGAVFSDDDAVADAIGTGLEACEFSLEGEGLIWAAVQRLAEAGETVDSVTVGAELERSGLLTRVEGRTRLDRIVQPLADVAHVKYWARLVRTDAARRALVTAALNVVESPSDVAALAALDEARERVRALERASMQSTDRAGYMLRELYNRPELLEPPPSIVHGFIYADRLTVMSCREKGGKSTLMGWLAAQCSHHMRVLWLGLEEPLGDPVLRFKGFGAEPDNILIIDRLVGGHDYVFAVIKSFDPQVIFLDSLSKWGDSIVTDWNASAQVTPVMSKLAELCHHEHRAMLCSHHAKKKDGKYRDSTAIGASADLLLEMFPVEADSNIRRFEPMGRMSLEPFALRYTGSGFEQVGGHVAVRDRVLAFVEANPGSSKRRIREAIRGSNPLVDQALDQLSRDGLIADHGTESRSQFNVTENGRGTVAARSAARCGDGGETQWGTVSARSRHGDGTDRAPGPLGVPGAARSPEPLTAGWGRSQESSSPAAESM